MDLLILKTLDRGRQHGYGIALHIERISDDLLRVEEGSLYPALHRIEQSGWIRAVAAGVLAVWMPARRASMIDPMVALRHE